MTFQWNPRKAALNRRKHGIDFEQAQVVFDDPLALSMPDPDSEEDRWVTVGHASAIGLVVVVHTHEEEMQDEVIRIISVRKATRRERMQYEQGDA